MPAQPVEIVRVERGGVVEATHRGHLVAADQEGKVLASRGDPGHQTYYRSCAKPFQALSSLRSGIVSRFGLTAEHVAIMCASHAGEPRHVELVRALLRLAEVPESALQCGAHWPGHEPTAAALRKVMDDPLPVFNNCSGKHAGMLAAAKALGAPLESYLDPAHPVQVRIRETLTEFTGRAAPETIYGIDGCSAPNPAVPLASIARSFAILVTSKDASALAVVAAMTENPFLVGGTYRLDTRLMEVTAGRLLAKGGAAGLHCTANRESGGGLAIKLESGDNTWIGAATVAALVSLGWLKAGEAAQLDRFAHPELRNWRQLKVGTVRAVFQL
jgi:L-asparaginase II